MSDKIAAIRARHEAGERASAVEDREWLLGEVERLREALRTIAIERAYVECQCSRRALDALNKEDGR